MEFFNKKIKIKWILKSSVYFKFEDAFHQKVLSRCFQIEAYPVEPKYQCLFLVSRLIIKLKIEKDKLYFYFLSRNFDSKSHELNDGFNLIKKEERRSKSNKNESCIDRCVNIKFIKKFRNITSYSIVDKRHFTTDQWLNSYFNYSKSSYKLVKEECGNKFKFNDCFEIRFEDYEKIDSLNDNFIKQIDLYFSVITRVEEKASIYKLLIDLLNILSILFGQNVLKLLLVIYCFLNSKYQLIHIKYYLFFIYLICLSGFIYHTYFILDQLLNEQLIHYVYFRKFDQNA